MNVGETDAFPSADERFSSPAPGMSYRQWLIGQAPPAPGPSTGKQAVINSAAWAIEWADTVIAKLDSEES